MTIEETFDIGEYALYGRWKVEIEDESITLTGMDWDTRKVERVKKFTTQDVVSGDLECYLASEITTSFYAGEIVKWIREVADLPEFDYNPW